MAIIENRVTEEGDVLIIKPEVPIVGLIGLSQFVDTTQNESETDYFKKQFRYSVDAGLTFSEWIDLSLVNIQNVIITVYNQFVIEYKYTRVGNAPDVDLEFNDILVSGEVSDLPYPLYNKTFFSKFFNVNDVGVFGWALNVLEKLYAKGLILPDYIKRGDNNSNLEDEDFITYWFSITHYFALIVYYAREYENIRNNTDLIVDFLTNRGVYFSKNIDTQELNNIFNDWVGEYSKRGTSQIYEKKNTVSGLDGELLRILNLEESDEFIFTNLNNFETGWCVSKSSPCWSQTFQSVNLIKNYLLGNNFENLPLILPEFISQSTEEDTIEIDSTEFSGIGYDGNLLNYLTVSELVSYEITFFVKLFTPQTELKCGVKLFDKNGNNVNSKNVTDEQISSVFIDSFQTVHNDLEYFVRLVIFDKNFNDGKDLDPNNLNSLGGNNLMFHSVTSRMIPEILVKGEANIRGLNVRPFQYNFSEGQLGIRDIYYLLSKNNSQLTDQQLQNVISENLIPYDNFLKTNLI